MTTGQKNYNIQVQVNRGTKISSLKNKKGTLAMALVPADGSWNAERLRQELRAYIQRMRPV